MLVRVRPGAPLSQAFEKAWYLLKSLLVTSVCYDRGEARTSPYLLKRDDGSCYVRRSIPLRSGLDHSQKTTMAGKAMKEKEAVPAVWASDDVGKIPIKTAAVFPQGGGGGKGDELVERHRHVSRPRWFGEGRERASSKRQSGPRGEARHRQRSRPAGRFCTDAASVSS